MPHALATPPEPTRAPELFRAALAELVQFGVTVARMVAGAAEAEIVLAASAAAATIAGGVSPLANSLAEAVEADQASAAAHEARQTVVARSQAIAAAFAQTARAIRRTIHLAERIDRAWAHPSHAGDSHPDTREAMARRQITRAVTEAIHRDAAGQRAEDLIDRLDSLDTLDDVTSRPAEDIVHDICRDLGLDVARMPPPTPDDHPVPPGLRTSLRGERRNSHRPQATAPPEAAR